MTTQMGTNGRALALREFSCDCVADKTVGFYRQVLAECDKLA